MKKKEEPLTALLDRERAQLHPKIVSALEQVLATVPEPYIKSFCLVFPRPAAIKFDEVAPQAEFFDKPLKVNFRIRRYRITDECRKYVRKSLLEKFPEWQYLIDEANAAALLKISEEFKNYN